jgi:hypothetical protein
MKAGQNLPNLVHSKMRRDEALALDLSEVFTVRGYAKTF